MGIGENISSLRAHIKNSAGYFIKKNVSIIDKKGNSEKSILS